MKLYLVVRSDLSAGARAAQLCHALRAFSEEHPEADREWYACSNTLVLLEIVNEAALLLLHAAARERDIPVSLFREPDLQNAATALALDPSGRTMVRHLPLALSASGSVAQLVE